MDSSVTAFYSNSLSLCAKSFCELGKLEWKKSINQISLRNRFFAPWRWCICNCSIFYLLPYPVSCTFTPPPEINRFEILQNFKPCIRFYVCFWFFLTFSNGILIDFTIFKSELWHQFRNALRSCLNKLSIWLFTWYSRDGLFWWSRRWQHQVYVFALAAHFVGPRYIDFPCKIGNKLCQ